MQYILIFLVSYLIGAFPTAYILAKLVKGVDIRTLGSGNMGATNVWRNIGKTSAIITLIIDIFKGWIVIYIAKMFFYGQDVVQVFAGIFAIIGHSFPVYLNFKGGKGVATSGGVFLALAPKAIGLALPIFVVLVAIFKYISLGSIISSLSIPFFVLIFGYNVSVFWFSCLIAGVVLIRHKTNIKRLFNGVENKFYIKK